MILNLGLSKMQKRVEFHKPPKKLPDPKERKVIKETWTYFTIDFPINNEFIIKLWLNTVNYLVI